ncbi:CsiV family protein [Pseudoalteromonas sp. SSDWG2]|uniref:CsiV family protein n=1 Tax=Pseudoalteromonas sp. SSDWG2 TaxID=3139391 RepID=UPI003BA8AE85
MTRIIAVLLASVLSTASYAQDGRWFEIEVMIFTQPNGQITETLRNEDIDVSKYAFDQDLLTSAYQRTLSQLCLEGKISPPVTPTPTVDFFAQEQPHSAICDYSQADFGGQQQLPTVLRLPEFEHTDAPYLLATSQLQFSDKIAELKRQGRHTILHTGWRFPGQSKRKAPRYRLFAGDAVVIKPQNVNTPLAGALPLPSTAHADAAVPLWQLDGFLKVHLNHYLYITSNLLVRESVDTDTDVSAEFSQFRRVISGEIHYFDHPHIGMLVQIRRFNH